MQNVTNFEFKLPDNLNNRRLNYRLTDQAGKELAQGELDLDQLAEVDAISVKELSFDQAGYALGDSTRTIVELQGGGPYGFRLVITLKDGNGKVIQKDERIDGTVNGNSPQEFLFSIP